MISTTSVPAIWALSGTAITMVFLLVYFVLIFLVFAAILYPLVLFARKIFAFISIKWLLAKQKMGI